MAVKNFKQLENELFKIRKKFDDSISKLMDYNLYLKSLSITSDTDLYKYIARQASSKVLSNQNVALACRLLLNREEYKKKDFIIYTKDTASVIRNMPNLSNDELETIISVVDSIKEDFVFENLSLGNASACFDILSNLCSIYYSGLKNSEALEIIGSVHTSLEVLDSIIKTYENELENNGSITMEEVIANLPRNELLSTEVFDLCLNDKKINFLKNFIKGINIVFEIVYKRFSPLSVYSFDELITSVPEDINNEIKAVLSLCLKEKENIISSLF